MLTGRFALLHLYTKWKYSHNKHSFLFHWEEYGLLQRTLQFKVPIQMGNAIWFLILAALSLILVAYTFYKKKT